MGGDGHQECEDAPGRVVHTEAVVKVRGVSVSVQEAECIDVESRVRQPKAAVRCERQGAECIACYKFILCLVHYLSTSALLSTV